MLIKTVRGKTPRYGSDCFIADNATLIGDVVLGAGCSVWFSAVVRGDVNSITVGDHVNIQDGAVIHGTYEKSATTIGNHVSIGHNAIVHGCRIHDHVLIGMGAIVMDDCIVEPYSIIAAGAVVPKNTHIKRGSVYAGVPAKCIKSVSPELMEGEIERIAKSYSMYASWFKED
ncbi:MAG TPA: gamma carbonic anhydrase family protein [Flavobacteriaceae bacterium]|jgi:carbonic anhydrase/acetyltransferase-like protein (isoleucine patch superfamily)|nr:gamma carbonic anhydrase family protein [Flavobacteriaceae bacterium]HCK06332.1 gamma carbonic anhydrase family protein [Flavobacteriaceae bacterium]